MVSWSTKRQLSFLSIFFVIILILFIVPLFFFTYKAPSCNDGKQNQGEQGADCGGPCSLLCKASAMDLEVHWSRSFKVKDGVYNSIAYVENRNLDSSVFSMAYDFKLYDKDNFLIYQRNGNTSVPPNKIFGIFESNILTGTRIPVRTEFEYQPLVWRRSITKEKFLLVTGQPLSMVDGRPRLIASVENDNPDSVSNVEVVAIIYDTDTGNAIATARSVIDSIGKNQQVPLIFTWPETFFASSTRNEFLYRFLR